MVPNRSQYRGKSVDPNSAIDRRTHDVNRVLDVKVFMSVPLYYSNDIQCERVKNNTSYQTHWLQLVFIENMTRTLFMGRGGWREGIYFCTQMNTAASRTKGPETETSDDAEWRRVGELKWRVRTKFIV
jgi:hypothetical protein